ncbi:MAG: lysophospholipid acyltransferase family protein [Planctomycetota bacterium]|jgi:KDO2-lipid IV(A) lauroyltransferase
MSLWRRLNRRFLIRYRIEYAIALTFVYGVRALSPRVAWQLARWIGRSLYRFGLRRRAVLANLAVAFPELGETEREELGRRASEHICAMIMDVLMQTRMVRQGNVLERIRLTGWARAYMDEHGQEGLRRRAHRVLFLTAHLGNWELASGFFSLLGVKISPVYRAMRNPFVDRLFRNIRLDSQYEVIERRGAVQVMLDRFEQGGNIGFLFDQEAVHGIYVPFFGVPACTHKTPAVLARDYGVKIFLGVVVREGDFLHYEARGELLDMSSYRTDDREHDLEEITAELMRRLEAEIRRNPDQYFWVHRRWKRVGVHGEEHIPEKKR